MQQYEFLPTSQRSIECARINQPTENDDAPKGDSPGSPELEMQEGTQHRVRLGADTHALATGLVFGRSPDLRSYSGLELTAVPATDGNGLISRNHLVLVPTERGLAAIDLGSTNGTVLHRNEQKQDMPPNIPVSVQPGDELEIGTVRLTIEVR